MSQPSLQKIINMQIVSRNKADILQGMRTAIMAQCDPDIQETFAPHHYTVEPLLIQLIREIRTLHDLLAEGKA